MNNDVVPHAVQEAWVIGAFVHGFEQERRRQEIITSYPEWFPWETKYREIPQEVHDAYYNEKYPPFDFLKSTKPFKGIWEQMNEKPKKVSKKRKKMTISEMVRELFENKEKAEKRAEKRKRKDKKLWDKYYKKYKLEYRG